MVSTMDEMRELMKKEASLRSAIMTVKGIGPAAKDAVPALLRIVARNDNLAGPVCSALGAIKAMPETCVPVLLALLRRSSGGYSVLQALGDFGPAAKEALPYMEYLVKVSRHPSRELRTAIARIKGEPIPER
jgi:hypothetical protein